MADQPTKTVRYNCRFPLEFDDAQIECWVIEHWNELNADARSRGLFFHYKRLFRLYWPNEDEQRWEDDSLRAILSNQFTTLMGSAGSCKTSTAAKFALCFYSVWPEGTTILVSSTDLRGLELRVWGRLKELIEGAKSRYDWFPGHVIDSRKCVSTHDLEEGDVRDMRQGIICIPCLSSSGAFVGLGKYVGIHNTRVFLVADECQLMAGSFLEAIPNLLNNPVSKFVFLGNPLAQNDPLDRVSEPKDGWSSVGVPKKTTSWTTRYMNGVCLNLPGLDSPNFDYPPDRPDRYGYMVGRQKEKMVRESYGEGSQQYCSQILGVRLEGLTARKVITREICTTFDAFRLPVWFGEARTKIYAVDAAYGSIGGDLCIGGWIEFGLDLNRKQVLYIGSQKIIPVSALSGTPPDDQIALFVKQECESLDIEEENVFFDGRTMLMAAFARLWNGRANPVDFGARPTDRPVSLDMKIVDPMTGETRLKKCFEHYSKFVTELWFSIRYTIESGQLCGMTEEILNDAVAREWKTVRSNLIEVEAKSEMKKRTGKSPDRTDQLATAIEGARRRGFQISKLANPTSNKPKSGDFLKKFVEEHEQMMKSRELQTI